MMFTMAPARRRRRRTTVVAASVVGLLVLAGCRPGTPLGALDWVRVGDRTVTATGWTFDPDAPGVPRTVLLTVDGRPAGGGVGQAERWDVLYAYGLAGFRSGFFSSATTPLGPGPHVVCAWADNDGPGDVGLVGCRRLGLRWGVDRLAVVGDRVEVSGWVYDATDPAAPLDVVLYDQSAPYPNQEQVVAPSLPRPGVAAAHPDAPAASGFAFTIAGAGQHLLQLRVRSGQGDDWILRYADVAIQDEGTDDDGICCVRRGLLRNAQLVDGGVHVDGHFGVGPRGGATPAIGGTTSFFVDGGAVYIQPSGRYGTPWVGASALLAAGVAQQAGAGFDAVLPTSRSPESVCLVAVPDGTPPPWPTLSCSPVNGDR